MAKRLPYSISSDDPDIVRFKEIYPDIYEMILDHKFNSFPGKEIESWNSLNELTGATFGEYIDHCIEHYNFLMGRWSQDNKDKIADFMLTLKDAEFGRNDAIKTLSLKIDELCSGISDSTVTEEEFNFSFDQDKPIPARNFNLWVTELSNAFVEISNGCEAAGLFNALIDTGSQAFVKKHHFLASQAIVFAARSHLLEENSVGSGGCFIPLIYKLMRQAAIWQQEDKAKFKKEGVPEQKKRIVESPDSFLFRKISNGQSSQLFRGLTREFFIKAWLFRFIESNERTTGNHLSKQELINEMGKRITEIKGMPNKTLENLLSNLQKPGYVSSRLDVFIE